MEQNIYFIGIGGIGMSALARYFKHEKYNVAGYDKTPSPLTNNLESEGIAIHFEDDLNLIPIGFRDPKTTTVIYTPAIGETNVELQFFRKKGFEIVKRAEVLGRLCDDKWTMAVAGTHGKTSTTTMVAWFNNAREGIGSAFFDKNSKFEQATGIGSAFLGGISKNFESNLVLGSGDTLAVEADEYDRSFLQLRPQTAVITAIDPDHLDIYHTESEFVEAFDQFASQVTQTLIVKKGITLPSSPDAKTYSLDDTTSDYYAQKIELLEGGYYRFDIVTPLGIIEDCRLGIPGLINVENCVAAVALVTQKEYDTEKMKTAIASFRGVARRFDIWINTAEKVYLDDYAHHPQELRAMISSVRSMFPGRHLTVIFQPHLYTRTQDFATDFAQELSRADRVILIPIYPAREQPIEGITSGTIFDRITCEKHFVDASEVTQLLTQNPTDVVVTAGAGDIDRLCAKIAQTIKPKNE